MKMVVPQRRVVCTRQIQFYDSLQNPVCVCVCVCIWGVGVIEFLPYLQER
jgi:hypothetical protein